MRTFIAEAGQVLSAARKPDTCSDRGYDGEAAFRCALLILLALGLLGGISQAQEPLVIGPTGDVSIGKALSVGGKVTAPKLDLGDGVVLNDGGGRNIFKDSEKSDGDGLRVGAAWGMYGIWAETGRVVVGGTDGVNLQNGKVVVNTDGNVGIGADPTANRLEVGGNANFSGDVGIAVGKKLRIEGGTDAATYFSFGGNGIFGIDGPGKTNGRFVVTNTGNVGIGVPAPDPYGAKLAVDGNVVVSGTINGEKPPVKFTINATGKNPWNTVVVDIQELCGDEDGCRIKLLMRNNNGQVRTSTEEIYISNPDWPKLNGGLGGDTRQNDGTEFYDWVLGTEAKHTLFKSHNWCQARNYVEGGHNLVGVSPTKMALNTATFHAFGSSEPKRDTAFQNNEKYRISFSCDPSVTATFIIYDR